jgi:SAM-dependent methyltransferase
MKSDFHVPSNWHETFFTEPANRFWESMISPEATRAEADFILRAGVGGHVIDVACGAGRHAIALARLGHRVTGVDSSAQAIARASAAAAAEALPASFIAADMRALSLGDVGDGMICMGNSIAYFDADVALAFLRNLAANLRRGGRIVLDTGSCAESVLPNLKEERRFDFEGGSYHARLAYDPKASLLKTAAELRLGAEEHHLLYAHYIVTVGELVARLAAVGIETISLQGDTAGADYVIGSPRLLLVGQKR